MKKNLLSIILIITLVFSFSCENYLSVEPEGYIPVDLSYKNVDDATGAVYGLFGMMQPLVDQLYLAGEAQGDLVIAGRGANNWIAEIAQNQVTPENPYTDFTNWYKLIVACNNTLKGVQDILKIDPVNYSLDRYNFDVAQITCIRSWTYLNLVKIWGDVPYISTDITSVDQITAVAPERGDTILGRIVKDVEASYKVINAIWIQSNSNSRAVFCIPATEFLLGEIYLEKGDLVNAYKNVAFLTQAEYNWENRGEIGMPKLGWQSGSSFLLDIRQYNSREWAFYINFDGSRGQKNSLQYWTNNKDGGIHALKPSRNAINNWASVYMKLMNYQLTDYGMWFNYRPIRGGERDYVVDADGNMIPGIKGDSLRGWGISYQIDGKDTLIFKYLIKDRNIKRSLIKGDSKANDDADFVYFRAGAFYPCMLEMINNLNMPWRALDYLNGQGAEASGGIQGFVSSTRSRSFVMPIVMDPNVANPVMQVNRYILEEGALEGAFEGRRWFNLVRMSKRPGYESWLGEYVSQKYPAAQREAIKTRLSNRDYWYFPYYYKNVLSNKLLTQKSGY